jgi:hypothetical protein
MPYKDLKKRHAAEVRFRIKNRKKLNAKAKVYRIKNNIRVKHEYYIKHRYGITIDEYNQKLFSQNGVCAICKESPISKRNYGRKNLAIDHNHETGQIRSLLCACCNLTLGGAKDSTALLSDMIAYLTYHSEVKEKDFINVSPVSQRA